MTSNQLPWHNEHTSALTSVQTLISCTLDPCTLDPCRPWCPTAPRPSSLRSLPPTAQRARPPTPSLMLPLQSRTAAPPCRVASQLAVISVHVASGKLPATLRATLCGRCPVPSNFQATPPRRPAPAAMVSLGPKGISCPLFAPVAGHSIARHSSV